MSDQITEKSLLLALTSDVVPGNRAGESKLDALVRDASFDPEIKAEVQRQLPTMLSQIHTSQAWHALAVLVNQLEMLNPILGEAIDRFLVSGAIDSLSQIWAAHCVKTLGADLSPDSLRVLEEAMPASPVQWFLIMRDTQDRVFVDQAVIKAARECKGDIRQLGDLVRSYKRWAVVNRFSWNVTISHLLDSLDNDTASSLVAALGEVLGNSFAARLSISRSSNRQREESKLSHNLFDRIENVALKLQWGLSNALKAA